MRAVDTNVLVRLLIADDRKQVIAAESFVRDGAWVSHLALAETIWVLESVYERTRAQIASAVAFLLDHKDLTLQDRDVVAVGLDMFRNHRGVSFSDCLMLEAARKAGHLPLGTFDKDLARLDGTELIRVRA